jgi:hypothetical protein
MVADGDRLLTLFEMLSILFFPLLIMIIYIRLSFINL